MLGAQPCQLLPPSLPPPPLPCLSMKLVSPLCTAHLSAPILFLRPAPENRGLPAPAGGGCPVVFPVATYVLYQRPISPWCLWVLGDSGYRMYLLVAWETLHSTWNGQDIVSPARLRMYAQHTGSNFWGLPSVPGWQYPWASASCGFGLPGRTCIKPSSCMAHPLPVISGKDTTVWEPKNGKTT